MCIRDRLNRIVEYHNSNHPNTSFQVVSYTCRGTGNEEVGDVDVPTQKEIDMYGHRQKSIEDVLINELKKLDVDDKRMDVSSDEKLPMDAKSRLTRKSKTKREKTREIRSKKRMMSLRNKTRTKSMRKSKRNSRSRKNK